MKISNNTTMKKIAIAIVLILSIAAIIAALSYHTMKIEASDWVFGYDKYEDKTESFVVWALSDSVAVCKAMSIFNEEKRVSLYCFKELKKEYSEYNVGALIPLSFKVYNFLGVELDSLSVETYQKISDEGKKSMPENLQQYWDCMDTLKVIKKL